MLHVCWTVNLAWLRRLCLLAGAAPGAASPLKGMQVVVLGAGGAGRALAFGALQRGAHITIANR